MRVLIVLDNLSLDSGVSSVVMGLYRNIKNVHFEFLIFKEDDRSYAGEIRERNDELHLLRNPLFPKTILRAVVELNSFFKKSATKYDAVHLHTPTIAAFTLRYAKKYGIPNRIIHSHSSMTSTNPVKKVLNQILTRNITRYANHYWTCSDKAAAFLYGEDFVKTHPVEMVYNGVVPETYLFDAKMRAEMRDRLGLQDKTVFCHVSNFSPIKNLPFLIPAIKQVVKQNPQAKFLFVGDGPAKAEFEAKLQSEGLQENCLFVGRQSDVLPYLQASDALLLPSLKEGLPVTVVEAQANGLPCFITDTITRQCDVGGVTYLPLEPEAWSDALCGFRADTEAHREETSRAFADSPFNIRTEAKRVEGLYLDMTRAEKN